MLRRIPPFVVALGVGLSILWWGLWRLQAIVIDERDQARAAVQERRATLVEYARRTLEQRLMSALFAETERFEAVLTDPLAPRDGLLLVLDGQQRIPASPRQTADATTPGRDLYDTLRRGDPVEGLEVGSPKARRVELVLELRDALRRGERDEITHLVQALLAHRAHFVVEASFDVPLSLAAIDEFVATAAPHPVLMDKLLRSGHDAGPGARVEGLQRLLAAGRERFSEPDLRFLTARVVALSRAAQLPVDDFEHALRPATAAAVPLPADLDAPMLLGGGHYFAAPHSASQLRGIAVDLPARVVALGDHMRARALLDDDDTLSLSRPTAPAPLAELSFAIESPHLLAMAREADERFRLKTAFVLATALLAAALVALAVLLQRRRQRFVELKSDFVATVSHELRTPLASIRLMAETLARRTRTLPGARDYPDRIVHEIDELSFLVENILSFNRLDKGRWQPRRQPVQLGPLVDALADDLDTYGFSDVQLHAAGIDGLVVNADRELLRLLLRNLAKNACTYNDRDPVQLRIAATVGRAGLVLDFEDNGIGIDPADQPRIFDDFRRGTADRSDRGKRARGSGLGLSICRKAVEAHGGRLSIARSDPSGTCFRLEFPATMLAEPR